MAENTAEDEVLDEKDNDTEVVEDKKDSEEEAPVRKSSIFYAQRRIIEKQAKKLEKVEKDEDSEEEVELTPKARTLIQNELSPVVEHMKSQADDIELREYLADNPEHKKFEKQIRKRMDAWKDVPVAEIAKTITYGQDVKTRADKKEEVTQRIQSKRTTGTSGRAEEIQLPSTDADFKKIYEEIKRERKTIKLGE